MQIIISPSKKMHVNNDVFEAKYHPECLEKTRQVLDVLKTFDKDELKRLWKVSDTILDENIKRLSEMDIVSASSPALFSYIGLQYESMGSSCLDEKSLAYLEKHLYILSAFYGYLHIFDAITPYRLEMQAKLAIGSYKNLYEFWADTYKDVFNRDDGIILNLASKEYSKAVERVVCDKNRIITCSFVEKTGNTFREKGTYAKMARGAMVRYLACNAVTDTDGVKGFDAGYSFSHDLSCDNTFVFVRIGNEQDN